jgi:hypothetical protein
MKQAKAQAREVACVMVLDQVGRFGDRDCRHVPTAGKKDYFLLFLLAEYMPLLHLL